MSNVTSRSACVNRFCDNSDPEALTLCKLCNDLAELDREVPLYDRYTRETVREQNYDPGNGRNWSGGRWDE